MIVNYLVGRTSDQYKSTGIALCRRLYSKSLSTPDEQYTSTLVISNIFFYIMNIF